MNDESLPQFSFWPILLALGIVLIPVGIVSIWEISIFGLLIIFASIMGWAWENREQPVEEEPEYE